MQTIINQLTAELSIRPQQVTATLQLLEEGATVPFIARYRKEATGGLTDTQLREFAERLSYLRELEDRRTVILKSIKEQDKLTPDLERTILSAETKVRLEDLYLPFKPKRRTKAQIAREAGLAPLADALLLDANLGPEKTAEQYINVEKGIADIKSALEGARHILMEKFAEDAELVGKLRDYLWQQGILQVQLIAGKEEEGAKFADYFAYQEAIKNIPSHRALALLRGRKESILQVALTIDETQTDIILNKIASRFKIINKQRPADAWLIETVRWTWKVKLFLQLEVELLTQLREQAEAEAIAVFAHNLKDLLLAAPAGGRVTMGLDPGFRSGVKVVVVDETGKLLAHTVIYPHQPQQRWDEAIATLAKLCQQHQVNLISIGNGTASRETDKLAVEVIKKYPALKLTKIVVSEAGASVYSASELAAKEFPDLDVSLRGAVSIARRLQDPLAELVKIDPKSIGVGQYQHDVNQTQLARSLEAVVEDCVNAVGVEVNSASMALLTRVAGLNETIARNIVEFRNQQGIFKNRSALKKVPRLGEKAFEQAAGFLRISNGANPLDASAVHPEAYAVVESIAKKHQQNIKTMIGEQKFLRSLNPADFVTEQFGIPTIEDIIAELEKPGRDPRPEFKTASFKEGIENLTDLKEGMLLEGTVTNVTNFGAFVDIGVHQDGLIHISALANRFIKDPREVVRTGDIVKVKVLSVDLPRKRVALSMRLES